MRLVDKVVVPAAEPQGAGAIEAVEALLRGARAEGASDLHFESRGRGRRSGPAAHRRSFRRRTPRLQAPCGHVASPASSSSPAVRPGGRTYRRRAASSSTVPICACRWCPLRWVKRRSCGCSRACPGGFTWARWVSGTRFRGLERLALLRRWSVRDRSLLERQDHHAVLADPGDSELVAANTHTSPASRIRSSAGCTASPSSRSIRRAASDSPRV